MIRTRDNSKNKDKISIQKFIAITSMMLTILFLFMSTRIIRQYVNKYEENDFAAQVQIDRPINWESEPIQLSAVGWPEEALTATVVDGVAYSHSRIVFIGDIDTPEGFYVKQWCQLTKRCLAATEEWVDTSLFDGIEAVLVMGDRVAADQDVAQLQKITELGTHIVFLTMPDNELIRENQTLRELMGILQVVEDDRQFTGIWVFDGFLLGGEALYRAYDEKTEARQDMILHASQYKLDAGTKTYMVGTLQQEGIRGEYLPPLVWRHNLGNTYVFAINGGYAADVSIMGILENLMFDKQNYTVRSVMNAQVFSVVGFPNFASQNEETMRTLYGRTQYGFLTEVLLPEIISTGVSTNSVLSCFAVSQYNYSDETEPDESIYQFFMREMRSNLSQVGLSFNQVGSQLTLAERMAKTQAFFDQLGTHYDFRSVYCQNDEVEDILQRAATKTVVTPFSDQFPVVGFLDEDTTIQSSLCNVLEVSYLDEFRMKSIQSLLLYSNCAIDFTALQWPESDEDEWVVLREKMTSNLATYWKTYKSYEHLSVSEADERLRSFAEAETVSSREGNTITICTSISPSYVLLKTHGESIESITGAVWKQVEEDTFLITMKEKTAEVRLVDTIRYQ